MFRNYLVIAWRNIRRNKVYSAINILGLATGIASCILIFLYVRDELTYESHFTEADRIVRIVNMMSLQGQEDKIASTSPWLAHPLAHEFPEVERVTQIMPLPKQTLWIGQEAFNEDKLLLADSSFFRIFDYDFVHGNPQTALDVPRSIVLSERLAVKYFGSPQEAIDQTIQFSRNRFTVRGVFRNLGHSHLQAEGFLTNNNVLTAQQQINGWMGLTRYTYALLRQSDQHEALQTKLTAFQEQKVNPWFRENELKASLAFLVQPLRDIHFDTSFSYDISPAGNWSYIYIFGVVAFFILLIACINYMNLATARSARRSREVGMRKVIGAYQGQLVRQFLGESLLITGLAVLGALVLVELLLPYFNSLTDKNFSLRYFLNFPVLGMLILILVLVGVGAGSYPSFFLARFKPSEVLKSDKSPGSTNALLRKGLVVLQFTISLVMIIGTLVVFRQMHFLKNKDLGFDKEHLVVIDIPVGDSTLQQRLPALKDALRQHPGIKMVSASTFIPGEQTAWLFTLTEGAEGNMEEKSMPVMMVDFDFLEVMGIELVAGRTFDPSQPTDLKGAFLVNQTAARNMGWDQPIGKKILMGDWDGQVIGVVKDFHFSSLHNPLEPLLLVVVPKASRYLLTRIQPEEVTATLAFIEEKWRAFDPTHPMERYFLDDNFDKQYRAEEKMLLVFGYFSGLTILIACLGLFGLSSFTAEQRTREVGIRKAMGSSTSEIVLLLSRDFAYLVVVSVMLASPIAWYGMHRWLQDFAYQTPIGLGTFVAAGLVAFLIAMFTVGVQAFRAALINPVQALRAP